MASVLDTSVDSKEEGKTGRNRGVEPLLVPVISGAAACVCTLGQAVNPVPVGHVALVRTYLHMCSGGILTFTVEVGQTMPKLLFPLQAGTCEGSLPS